MSLVMAKPVGSSLRRNMVAGYPMKDGVDIVGGNDMTFANTTQVDGKVGKAQSFNGTTSYGESTAVVPKFAIHTKGTVVMRAYIDADDDKQSCLLSIGAGSGANRTELSIFIDTRTVNSSDWVQLVMFVDGVLKLNASTPADSLDPLFGAYGSIIVTHNGTEYFVYINGVLKTINYTTGGAPEKAKWLNEVCTAASNPADTLILGAVKLNTGVRQTYLGGDEDEVAIYDGVWNGYEAALYTNHGYGVPLQKNLIAPRGVGLYH